MLSIIETRASIDVISKKKRERASRGVELLQGKIVAMWEELPHMKPRQETRRKL